MTKENFDWVSARAECSVTLMFQRLAAEIEADIATRNKQLANLRESPYKFRSERQSNRLIVAADGFGRGDSYTFQVVNSGIVVSDANGKAIHTATLTLNNEGECRLWVDDGELETWQFRKRVLEDFFFRS